jgi:hypothetical protein
VEVAINFALIPVQGPCRVWPNTHKVLFLEGVEREWEDCGGREIAVRTLTEL